MSDAKVLEGTPFGDVISYKDYLKLEQENQRLREALLECAEDLHDFNSFLADEYKAIAQNKE